MSIQLSKEYLVTGAEIEVGIWQRISYSAKALVRNDGFVVILAASRDSARRTSPVPSVRVTGL